MTEEQLKPWMLRADWRDDERALVVLDLSGWPDNLALSPKPPVPVLAFGDRAHPIASQADLLVGDAQALKPIAERILRTPKTAAAIVDLLRSIEGGPADQAIIAESFAFGMLQGAEDHRLWLSARDQPAPSPAGGVILDRNGQSLTITVNRPWAGNAIDRGLRDALFEAFSLVAMDPEIQSVNLRAEGRCFGLGADLAEFGTTQDPSTSHAIRMRTLPALALLPRAEIYHAYIQGACVGASLEMAAFAGRVTATSDAWFQLPEMAMGILPGAGGCVSISRRIGRQRTALLILSGRRISARTALTWGLIDAIVDDLAADERCLNQVGGQL